jgi:hypothetical protein
MYFNYRWEQLTAKHLEALSVNGIVIISHNIAVYPEMFNAVISSRKL